MASFSSQTDTFSRPGAPIQATTGDNMQRWVKIPDGRYLDANRIAYVGKVETFNRIDENGIDLGLAYAVNLGSDFPRESQINVVGTKDEIFSLLRGILGGNATAAASSPSDAAQT